MSDIIPFAYEGAQLRTVMLDGDPWFVAPDACRMLDLQDTTSALKLVDDDDKCCLRRSDTPQLFAEVAPQVQLLNVVNEPAMYVLILQSQKDRAKVIRRWLTHEVLPEIRRSGSYGQPVQRLTPLEYARALLAAEERAEAESVGRAAAEARVAELEPGATAWSVLANADGVYAVGDVAKMLYRDLRSGYRHQYACQSVPLCQRVLRTAERGGLSGPQPHRPRALTRRGPRGARLDGSWLALGWRRDAARLPTLRVALGLRKNRAVILAVDLGKTFCRAAAGGRRAEGVGAPGLGAPGGVRAAEAAILSVASSLGPGAAPLAHELAQPRLQ